MGWENGNQEISFILVLGSSTNLKVKVILDRVYQSTMVISRMDINMGKG